MPQSKNSTDKITVRMPKFQFSDDIPTHWFADSPLFTHLANALFLSFPQGERFFIRSVQEFAGEVKDAERQKEIRAFIGQEAQHSNIHEEHFELLRRQGYPVDQILATYKTYAGDGIENIAEALFGKRMHLAMTSAAEHYTALFAEQAFEWDIFQYMEETMGELAAWHAAEELEHKHVAFEVMDDIDISYTERVTGMIFVSVLMAGVTTLGMIQLLVKDGLAGRLDFGQLASNIGLVFQGLLPWNAPARKEDGQANRPGPGFLNGLVLGALDYFRPGFHPDDRDNRKLAAEAVAQLEARLAG